MTMNFDLKRFIVFNTSDGQGEGREKDKLLFHWTKDVTDNKIDITEQIDDVCMCDASITTSSRLSKDISGLSESWNQSLTHDETKNSTCKVDPINYCGTGQSIVITFDPTSVIMVEVEPNQSIWMAAHIAPEKIIGKDDQNRSSDLNSSAIPAEAVKQVVRNIYLRFCLLNGTFQMIAEEIASSNENDDELKSVIRDAIRQRCENYFSAAMTEIHLTSIISNVASLHNYIVYLDLNPLTLMKVISFINHLVSIDPSQILHTITIFNDQLIWSSLGLVDSRLLYNYLVAVLIREALQEELVKEMDKVRLIAEDKPIYLRENIDKLYQQSEDIESRISALTTNDSIELKKYYLTVFRSSNNLTLGLIFKDEGLIELKRKCEQMLMTDSRLGVIPLASLAKLVGQNFIKTSAGTYSAIANSSSNSIPSKRQQSNASISSVKNVSPYDHRYLSLDRLSFSVSSLFNVEPQYRDGSYHGPSEGVNREAPGNRKLRFIKYLLELESDMKDISMQTGCRVEEYFARMTNDIWLTVLNSKYRCIYSLYKMRNAGLNEARENAINLKSSLVINRS
jgi:hypothetical protein